MKRLIISLFVYTTVVFATTIHVPADSTTIQAGLNGAQQGDTVLVAAGTYLENIRWPETPDISLIGEGRETTIIDGNGADRVIWIEPFTVGEFYSYGNSRIQQLTIQNGYSALAGGGSGIFSYRNSDSLFLDDVNILNNAGNAALYFYGSNYVSLNNVLMEENRSWNNHGLAIYSRSSNLTLNNTTITNNDKGIFVWDGGPAFQETTLIRNSIIWDNYDGDGEMTTVIFYDSYPLIADIDYSLMEGGMGGLSIGTADVTLEWGVNNIDGNPYFCDPDSGDYTLGDNSPCVGSGENLTNMGAFDVGCGPLSLSGEIVIPTGFVLHQNYPNPFNPTTTIRFSLSSTQSSQIQIFDITGRLVETLIDEPLTQGEHEIVWNAGSQPSGVYFVRLQSGEFVKNQKVILLK